MSGCVSFCSLIAGLFHLCLHKPLVALLKQKGFLAVNDNGVSDAAAADLGGCSAALVFEAFDGKNAAIGPANQSRTDDALFINVQIDADISFFAGWFHKGCFTSEWLDAVDCRLDKMSNSRYTMSSLTAHKSIISILTAIVKREKAVGCPILLQEEE